MEKKRISIWQIIPLLVLLLLGSVEIDDLDELPGVFPSIFLLTAIAISQKRRFLPLVVLRWLDRKLQPLVVRWRWLRIRLVCGRSAAHLQQGECVCLNCGSTFAGNFCNRCGQSRSVSRLTWNSLLSQILRAFTRLANGYKRTVAELIYRPGYMIADYMSGRRVLYVAPFQALFFTAAIYIVTVKVICPDALNGEQPVKTEKRSFYLHVGKDGNTDLTDPKTFTSKMKVFGSIPEHIDRILGQNTVGGNVWHMIKDWAHGNKAASALLTLPLLAFATYLTNYRRRQKQPFNPTEHFFIQSYIATQLLFLSTLSVLLTGHASSGIYDLPWCLIYLFFALDIGQIYRYTWQKALLRAFLTAVVAVLTLVLLALLIILILKIF